MKYPSFLAILLVFLLSTIILHLQLHAIAIFSVFCLSVLTYLYIYSFIFPPCTYLESVRIVWVQSPSAPQRSNPTSRPCK